MLFVLLSSNAQHLKFKTFDIKDGLSSNSIIDIENDKNGALWIATINGLNFFDGKKFKIFKHKINDQNTIPNNYIISILKDNNNSIWLYTQNKKVSKYIGNDKFKTFHFNDTVKSIRLSKTGNIFVNTQTKNYEYVSNKFIPSKLETKNNNKNFLKQLILKKYPNLIINDILKDKQGNIWYATRRNGLYIIPNNTNNINNENIDHYTKDIYSNHSFKSNEIDKLHLDSFNNIWLGHKDGGLSMAYPNSEKIVSVTPHPIKQPNLPNETIRAITKDYNDNIWLGYYTKGLFKYNKKNNSFTQFTIKEAFKNPNWNRIRNLFTSSNGTVWVGTYAGLIAIVKDQYVLYDSKKNIHFPNNRNYSIFEDDNNFLWIACWGGLAKFNLNTLNFEPFKAQRTLSNFHVRNIKIINDELIISTENNGVILLDLKTGNIKSITKKKGLLSNNIYNVYKDSFTKYYWIASLGGISIYDTNLGIIKNLTEENGLPSNLIYSIINNNDEVWISSPKGIGVINKDSFKINSINPKDGWQSFEFSEGAYYQDTKGVLFYGGINGLNYFKPSDIHFQQQLPKIKIIVDKNENYNQIIKKKYTDNSLSIKLSPTLFPKSKHQNILYKLNGLEKDWKKFEYNEINYTNLIPGTYTFFIKKNKVSKPLKIITTIILKPFYQKNWFITLIICTLFLIILFSVYKRNKNIRRHNKTLEEKITERTLEIKQQKEDLLTKNNLLDEKNKQIILQKEKLLQLHNNLKIETFEIDKFKEFLNTEFKEPITEIIKVTHEIPQNSLIKKTLLSHTKKLINQITEWNYLDNIKNIGKYEETTIQIFPIINEFIEKQKAILQKREIDFTCEINSNLPWIAIDILRLKLLLQYLFHDIIKYSNAKSILKTYITYENSFLIISIISSSTILKDSWYNVKHYSPYYKALKSLMNDLGVKETIKNDEYFEAKIKIPAQSINMNSKLIETISLKYLDFKSPLLNNKKRNILIHCNKNNYETSNQLLSNQDYNIFYEENISDINSALKVIKVEILILYQISFTSKLIPLLNNLHIPIIYISENIDNSLNEQSIELGIDTVLQLPISRNLIHKKIKKIIAQKTNAKQLSKEVFQILTEDKEIITSNEKLLKKSLTTIKHNLDNTSFNVEQLTSKLGISKIKCYRLFKDHLQQSPSDILIKLRLEKACHLLLTQDLNISEISFECGYKDPKYFSRLFKKHYNLTPKVYKEQNTQLLH